MFTLVQPGTLLAYYAFNMFLFIIFLGFYVLNSFEPSYRCNLSELLNIDSNKRLIMRRLFPLIARGEECSPRPHE
jgi:hypothetical protein